MFSDRTNQTMRFAASSNEISRRTWKSVRKSKT
jgi:hypothetical protein